MRPSDARQCGCSESARRHRRAHNRRLSLIENCLHGSLLRVHECGVLILGAPGAGKSRLALELIMEGHALVADDLVLLQPDAPQLRGSACESAANRLAIRGAGIIDVMKVFGPKACYTGSQTVNWVTRLDAKHASVLPEHSETSIASTRLPCITLQPHSRDAKLIALCCRLGSDALHQWKMPANDNASPT